jgi:hypothetical protein
MSFWVLGEISFLPFNALDTVLMVKPVLIAISLSLTLPVFIKIFRLLSYAAYQGK